MKPLKALIRFDNLGYIRPGTFFVTIHFHNLRTTLPHHLIIENSTSFFFVTMHNVSTFLEYRRQPLFNLFSSFLTINIVSMTKNYIVRLSVAQWIRH